MSDFKVSGKQKVMSFYKNFAKEYPYLYASLRYPDDKAVNADLTIANARVTSLGGVYSPTGASDLSVSGNLKVRSFEKQFQDVFSVRCNIHFRRNGKWVATGPKYDDHTLAGLNAAAKEEGCEPIAKFI
jgi:hypothetical protein